MTCPRIEDLSAFVDHALPARRQAALQSHLRACPVCSQQLDALRALRQELHALIDMIAEDALELDDLTQV